MNEILDPDKIFQSFIRKEISKAETINILKAILEKSNKNEMRIKSLRIFEALSADDHIFKILENSVISDENVKVRELSSKIIINYYLSDGAEIFSFCALEI